ncbi:hypothetical protein D3C75_1179890 [compost metagenome]
MYAAMPHEQNRLPLRVDGQLTQLVPEHYGNIRIIIDRVAEMHISPHLEALQIGLAFRRRLRSQCIFYLIDMRTS